MFGVEEFKVLEFLEDIKRCSILQEIKIYLEVFWKNF